MNGAKIFCKVGKMVADIAGIIVGIVAIFQSFQIGKYAGWIYETASKETYGGDAYTGMQNAMADVDKHIARLNDNIADVIMYVLPVFLAVIGVVILCCFFIKLLKHLEEVISMKKIPSTTNSIPASIPTNIVENPENSTVYDALEKYNSLLEAGAITQEEFDAKKQEILNI